jgi:hypothetical protein
VVQSVRLGPERAQAALIRPAKSTVELLGALELQQGSRIGRGPLGKSIQGHEQAVDSLRVVFERPRRLLGAAPFAVEQTAPRAVEQVEAMGLEHAPTVRIVECSAARSRGHIMSVWPLLTKSAWVSELSTLSVMGSSLSAQEALKKLPSGGWTASDITVATTVVARIAEGFRQPSPRPPEDPTWRRWAVGVPTNEFPIASLPTIRSFLHASRLASAAYTDSEEALNRSLESVLQEPANRGEHGPLELVASHLQYSPSTATPAYYMAVDHAHKRLYMVTRGIWGAAESAVVVAASRSPFQLAIPYPLQETSGMQGVGHTGFLASSIALWEKLRGPLEAFYAQHPDYQLITVGHSLGAPAAAIVALNSRRAGFGPPNGVGAARSICFATPAFVSPEARLYLRDVCDSVIMGEDFVPRIHFLALERLRVKLTGGEEAEREWDRHVASGGHGILLREQGQGQPSWLFGSLQRLLKLAWNKEDTGKEDNGNGEAPVAARRRATASAVSSMFSAIVGGHDIEREQLLAREGVYGATLTTHQYLPAGQLHFLRPARWFSEAFASCLGDERPHPKYRFVRIRERPGEDFSLEPGNRYCLAEPRARWLHGSLTKFPLAVEQVVGDMVLSDSMIRDHLVDSVSEELAALVHDMENQTGDGGLLEHSLPPECWRG